MSMSRLVGTLGTIVSFGACGGSPGPAVPEPVQGEEGGPPSTEIRGRVGSGEMSADHSHYETVVDMLRGRAPGLQIIAGDGRDLQVRIRGVNQTFGGFVDEQPLVVVDGVPQSRPAGEALLALNPGDVSRIEVLKDVASTSIYGTRGANGVILVQMKRRD